jgi:taurine dioxygenase
MALSYQPLMEHFGAAVTGVDLASDFSDAVLREIMDAYYSNTVLLFRGQKLDPDSLARLLHRVGRPKIESRKQFNLRDHPEVSTVGNIVGDGGKPLAFLNRGGIAWHTDGGATCHSNAATFLYAVEAPKEAGDTLYCSTVYAYETLSDALKQKIDAVWMLSSFPKSNDRILARDPNSHEPLTPEERAALPDVWHSVVQTHPVTGRKTLYISRNPHGFQGIAEEEARDTIRGLFEHATQPDLVYRHHWAPGDLIIWDNLSTLHSQTESERYEDDRRLMFRAFVYLMPTDRPHQDLDAFNAVFLEADGKGALVLP